MGHISKTLLTFEILDSKGRDEISVRNSVVSDEVRGRRGVSRGGQHRVSVKGGGMMVPYLAQKSVDRFGGAWTSSISRRSENDYKKEIFVIEYERHALELPYLPKDQGRFRNEKPRRDPGTTSSRERFNQGVV